MIQKTLHRYRWRVFFCSALPLLLSCVAWLGAARAAEPAQPGIEAAAQGLSEKEIEDLIKQAEKLQEAGDLKAAAEIYKRLLAWSERVNGPDHAFTGAMLFRLGSIYAEQGDVAKAEPLLVRELAISEKTSGPQHLDTAASLLKLGSLYADQNQVAKVQLRYRHG